MLKGTVRGLGNYKELENNRIVIDCIPKIIDTNISLNVKEESLELKSDVFENPMSTVRCCAIIQSNTSCNS